MVVIHCVDQGFPLFLRALRVNALGDFSQNGFVERTGNDLSIELLYIKIQLIIQQLTVGNLTSHRIIECHRIAGSIVNTFIP